MAEQSKEPKQQSQFDDDRSHQAIDSRLVARLWAYLVPYRWSALACVIISVAVAALRLCQPIIIHRIFDNEIVAADNLGIAKMSLVYLGIVILVLVSDIYFNYATGVIGQKSMHDLRMDIFRHVNGLDVAFFDRTPVGRLITRMTSDVSTLNDLFSSGVIAMLAETLMLSGLVLIMLFYSVRLTLVVLCAVPFMLVVLGLFRKHSRKWYLEGRTRLAKMNAYLQENIAGMRTVQSFNREARNYDVFKNLNDFYRASQVQTILAFALFYPALNLILYFTLTGVVWVGGRRVIEGIAGEPLTFATLFLFVQCVNLLFTPLRNLSEKYNILQSAMASSARIFRLLDTEASIRKPEHPVPIRQIETGVRFDHVGFEYLKGEPVLHDISFEIERGQTVAVVGATGSGKTTLVNLLTRFYEVNQGRVLIDGTDIRQFDPHELRRLFAVVLQEVFLFSDTIAGNIRLANANLTDDQIWDLLRRVHAEDFVKALPNGLNAPVHERGGTFSTGQKQLLAFARALAANPQILVLDEATANVDTATEQRIQDAILQMLEGRTALVIAHRISTIKKADLIIAMHKGRIKEAGTHDELIAQDGLYRRLYELQFRPESVEGQAS